MEVYSINSNGTDYFFRYRMSFHQSNNVVVKDYVLCLRMKKKRVGFDWYKMVTESRQGSGDLLLSIFYQESPTVVAAAWALKPTKASDLHLHRIWNESRVVKNKLKIVYANRAPLILMAGQNMTTIFLPLVLYIYLACPHYKPLNLKSFTSMLFFCLDLPTNGSKDFDINNIIVIFFTTARMS